IFEEQAPPEIVMPHVHTPHRPHYRSLDRSHDDSLGWDEPPGAIGPRPRSKSSGSAANAPARPDSSSAPPPPAATRRSAEAGAPVPDDMDRYESERCCDNGQHRPGLGTEFGEQRYSAVSWTQFVRASASKPSAIAELRYNDAAGLQALGIRLYPARP